MKQRLYPYRPDYATAPGETISELMVDKGMSVERLASELDLTIAQTARFLKGRRILSDKIAGRLEQLFNVPARFWLALERNYRDALARKRKRRSK